MTGPDSEYRGAACWPPLVPSVGAVPVEVPEEGLWPPAESYHWRCAEGLLKLTRWDEWRSWGIGRQSAEITKLAEALSRVIPDGDVGRYVAEHVARVRAEERQRVAEGLDEFVVDDPEIGRDYGFNAGLQQARWVITSGFAAGSAVPVATPGPVEVASLSLDDLPDWTELAEATGATLHNSEIGCSGEYETTMRWPDGRTAGNRDRLAIISADSELPSIAEQVTAYRQVEAEYAAERAARLPVATPTEPDPPEGAQRKPDRPDSFCNHTVEEGCTGHGDF